MTAEERKIFGKFQKHFAKIGAKRITFYNRKWNKVNNRWDYFNSKKYKREGRVHYKRLGYVNVSKWEELKETLIRKPIYTKKYRDVDLPEIKKVGLQKVFLRPTKLKFNFKTATDRKRHTSVFLAYTKEHIKKFRNLKRDKKLPIQIEKGFKTKISKIIDLSKRTKTVDVTSFKQTGESP
jgi:hypothetical protein